MIYHPVFFGNDPEHPPIFPPRVGTLWDLSAWNVWKTPMDDKQIREMTRWAIYEIHPQPESSWWF